jgi:hypothetical protein
LQRACAASLAVLDRMRNEHDVKTAAAAPPADLPKLPPAPEMAAALNHPSDMHVQHDYLALAERLGPEATVRALEAVWQQRERRVFKVFFTACSGWAEKDFAAFRTHVEQMGDPDTVAIARMALMKYWQRTDEAAALAWANQLPPVERDSLLRSAKLYAPRSADPNQRLAKALAEPGHLGEAITIFADWAKKDPAAAAARALAFEKKSDRLMAVSGVLRGWVEQDPAAALAWVQKFDAPSRADAYGALFDAWARRDLETALTTAQTLGDEFRPGSLARIAPILFAHDRDRALMLLETIPLKDAEQGYFTWGQSEPAAATSALLRRAAAELGPNRSPGDDLVVELHVGTIIQSWAQRDLPAAAAFVMAQPGPVRDYGCLQIVMVWQKSDPRGAVDWILTLPDFADMLRRAALEQAVNGWIERSETEAIAWADGLANDSKRDAVVAAVVRAIMPHDANAALTRLRTIHDPKQQRETFYAAWRQWAAHGGRSAAERWRDSADLSPAERQLLISGR